MCDKASVHLTESTKLLRSEVTRGMYLGIPVYSPHLNPIKILFSIVWQFIQAHEEDSVRNPLKGIMRGS